MNFLVVLLICTYVPRCVTFITGLHNNDFTCYGFHHHHQGMVAAENYYCKIIHIIYRLKAPDTRTPNIITFFALLDATL